MMDRHSFIYSMNTNFNLVKKLEEILNHLSSNLEIEKKRQFLSQPTNLSINITKLV